MVTENDVLRILETSDDFSPLPTTASEIALMISESRGSAPGVTKLISKDEALCARLLKVINSSFYRFSEPVPEIFQAVNLLGYEEVGILALGLSVMDTFSKPLARGFDQDLFWEKSVCNSVAAGMIAARFRREIPGITFTAGLLQDIGRLFLAHYFPMEYGGAIHTAKDTGYHPAKVEREMIGLDHGAVGAILARHWNLPPIIEETIREHHFAEFEKDLPPSPETDLIRVLNLSNMISDVLYDDDLEEEIPLLEERGKRFLDLGSNYVEDILEELPEKMEEAASTFEFKISLKPSLDDPDQGPLSLNECPNCGAKGFGKFCGDCGVNLISAPPGKPNKRVLIAEDSMVTRRALSFVIKRAGYEVIEAVNGEEALKLARTGRPGLILLDIMMPVMGGLNALKQLRGRPDTAEVPIIILTARTDSETVIEAIGAGANDYILKPYTARAIVERVQKYFEETPVH